MKSPFFIHAKRFYISEFYIFLFYISNFIFKCSFIVICAGPINLPRRLNSGFYYAHSDGQTIAAMEKVVRHAETSGLSEQPSFYDILCGQGGSNLVGDNRCVEPETNLTVHFLDRDLFPNGAYHDLWQENNVNAACLKKGCFIIHNNWISGRLKKLERQVLSGLWEYDPGTRTCLRSWHTIKP